MNIAIGADAVDFDEQAVDLVVGVAQNLRDVAELLAVRADEVGLEQLRLAESQSGGEGAGDGRAGFGSALQLVFGRFILVVACCEERRSEEHTSELQSLMRISYAVFCLKKKIKIKNSQHIIHLLLHIILCNN